MQWVVIVLAIIFYIYRFVSKQKQAQEEAQRRRQQIPPNTSSAPSTTTSNPEYKIEPQPKTIDEILKEMHRRVEEQSKPFAKPVVQKPMVPKMAAKKEAVKPTPKAPVKKEPEPFLTEEYSAYKIEEAKIPANMATDFIKQGQLVNIDSEPKKKSSPRKNFNLQDAVIAQIILQRPEW